MEQQQLAFLTLFAQKQNIVNPCSYQMIRELVRYKDDVFRCVFFHQPGLKIVHGYAFVGWRQELLICDTLVLVCVE
jgi:predicted NAD/FAD-binding protein